MSAPHAHFRFIHKSFQTKAPTHVGVHRIYLSDATVPPSSSLIRGNERRCMHAVCSEFPMGDGWRQTHVYVRRALPWMTGCFVLASVRSPRLLAGSLDLLPMIIPRTFIGNKDTCRTTRRYMLPLVCRHLVCHRLQRTDRKSVV